MVDYLMVTLHLLFYLQYFDFLGRFNIDFDMIGIE
jgi:hypothetical protein